MASSKVLAETCLLLLVILLSCDNICSWKLFHNGRARGGMLGEPRVTKPVHLPPDEWFIQLLDHDDPTNNATWKQRYFTNNSFYKPGGPIFLMIGGEGKASPLWLVEGQWIEYAKENGAFCFQLEHRFYGKSHPTEDLSVKNLKYLSSEQALADAAYFIEAMNKKYNFGIAPRWVAFGGSYPGSLAAWLRAKYPHLVHAAVSTSGPLLAKPDFREYYQVVQGALDSTGTPCVEVIQQATSQLQVLIQHPVGQRTINKLFRLCAPIDSSKPSDKANLFQSLASNFAGVVQYNKDNRKFEGARATNITVDVVCKILTNDSLGTEVDRYAAFNSLLLDAYDQECLDYEYDKMINDLRQVDWKHESAEGGRQWTYQTCTEFGFFQTSSSTTGLFGDEFPVEFFIQMCSDIFGPKYNEELLRRGVYRTNTNYGAFHLQVSRVVFVHGSIDPWHVLGITYTLLEEAPAIYIDGTAHCANMYPAAPTDPPGLTAARKKIGQYLQNWLKTGDM